MQIRILFFLICLLGTQLHSQVVTFQTTYEMDAIPAYQSRTNIINTMDGGFLMPGINWDPLNADRNLLLLKTLADGNLQWAKRLESNLFDQTSLSNAFAIELDDGGFAVEALIKSANSGDDPSIVVFRTDAAANVIWERSFKGTFRETATVLAGSDGSITLTGTLAVDSVGHFWAARLDASGSFLWAKTFEFGAESAASSACLASNGDILITGMVFYPGIDMGVVRVDPTGNLIWGKVYQGAVDDQPIEIKSLSNGDCIFVGRAGIALPNTGCWDIVATRITANGNIIWSNAYGGEQCDEGYSIIENTDGTLVLACEPESFIGTSQSALLKLSSAGNIIWMKTYNDDEGTFPSSVIRTPDGGYALAGVYGIFSSNVSPLFLNKTNENGDVNCGTKLVHPHQLPYELIVLNDASEVNSFTPIVESHLWTNEGGSATVVCERGIVIESVSVPNVFTPNEDGINDLFILECIGISSFRFWIYDRWGVLMFESSDPYLYWNGNARSGNPATDGTYYYVVETDVNSYTGFFTLIR